MEVSVRIEGIKEALERFDPKKVRSAARSAINKIADQTRTFASRQIREEFNVPASRLNSYLRVSARAKGDDLQAVITGRGLGMALSYFGPRQAGIQVSKKKGFRYTKRAANSGNLKHGGVTTVEVRRGNRKEISGDPKPFLTIFKSGHIAVVQRMGKGRLPLKQLLGPGIGGLFGSKLFMPRTTKFVNEKFGPIFNHELGWWLSK